MKKNLSLLLVPLLAAIGVAAPAEALQSDSPPQNVQDVPTTTTTVPSAADTAQQVLSLSVRPGPLTVGPSAETINLTGGAGNLSPIKVIDARGSLVGWTATVTMTDGPPGARLCVTPNKPTTVAGNPPEVRSAPSSCGTVGEALVVFYAPPDGGGGTFSDTGSLAVSGGDATVSVAVEVG